MPRITAILLFTMAFAPALQAQEKPPPPPPPPLLSTDAKLPKIIRKSGGVLQRDAIKRVHPAYPPLAKAAAISGDVVIELTVDEEGNVIQTKAITGHPLLRDSAIEAAKEWKFKPTKLSGVPVKVIGTITFKFTLDNAPEIKEIAALEEKVRESPDSAEARYELGAAYYNSKKYAEAETELKKAVRINPDHAEAQYNLGLTIGVLKRYEEALDHFAQAVKLNPEYAEAFAGMGLAYAALYRYEDAIKAFQKCIELEPSVADTYLYLAMTYSAMDRNEDAIAVFKEALAIRPDDANIHYRLGCFYIQTGDKEAAMDEYNKLKKIDPQIAEALMKEINK